MSLGSGGGRFVHLWHCCLFSEEVGLFRPGPCGSKLRRHQMVQCWGWSTRDGDTGNAAVLLGFFKLDKYAMFSFAMTSGLASDSDKFKILITLRRVQKNRDTWPYKNFIFFV